MAQIREVRLVDDTDGGDAAETVEFSLDGKSYEIDLSSENADHLRGALAPYIAAGRRAGGRLRPGRPAPVVTSSNNVLKRSENDAIRKWAQDRGHEISGRGRIAKKIRDAYYAENGAPEFAAAS